ncbi:pyrroline-5-carboxylate reductase [Tautonia plasticadhaerens]|uniref:Pyrroline-5-carboxylate reductase n=1 Tax=Tautonia plasticadhaerens TaxID=2527974 RepID=A0A518H5P8_9BACT|nr:pyrroline-5-carboxylate reductase [Tautonia plasticadhaerens]QDV36164.1 Pyrroline-5-carboxylate reductase [Tautonia plasticadhaerens]
MTDSLTGPGTRWGFIGAGKMASALIRGMVRAGTAPPSSIAASDPSPEARAALEAEGVMATGSNAEVADRSDVIVLAVKPQAMDVALGELGGRASGKLVVSVAAGVMVDRLASGLGPGVRVVRVMPNTPALVGEGAAAYCLGPGVTGEDEGLVLRMLQSVGIARRVPESLMDAATGLCGSGPAFVYAVVEAMSDGGVLAGLPRDLATAMAAQTVLGSARMVLETGLHPGALKDQVTSPGGTTIAGVHALERGGLRAALIDAVKAAATRSAELAEEARGRPTGH